MVPWSRWKIGRPLAAMATLMIATVTPCGSWCAEKRTRRGP